MVWGLGTVLGPLIGGALELYSWRWAFYINLCFAVFILPAYLYLIPAAQPAPNVPVRTKLLSFDWAGAILSTGFVVTFIMATNFGGASYDWNSGTIIALYVVSGVLFITWAIQQRFSIFTRPENRMFPVHLLRNREATLLFIMVCCGGTIAYVSVYYIPLYYQFARGDTAIKTAERILPLIILLIFGMLSNGYLMSRLGYYKPWYIFGACCSLVGSVLMSKTAPSPSILLACHL
jgi:MFS family permease